VEVKNVLIYYIELITAVKRLSVPALGCTDGLGIPKMTYNLISFIILVWAPYQVSNHDILSKLGILDKGGSEKCSHLLHGIAYGCKKVKCTSPWMH
jgi:hypothetical protein